MSFHAAPASSPAISPKWAALLYRFIRSMHLDKRANIPWGKKTTFQIINMEDHRERWQQLKLSSCPDVTLIPSLVSILTSSLKRSCRLMRERRRTCFSSCSSSESGCLKYSIRSLSVCSTSSMYLATAVDSPAVVLSKALED